MAIVDVIIPLYNKQATIERAIRSVQSQTFSDWRLIVVDDGSTDQGPQIVDHMRRHDLRIELIGQSNAGPGAARNAGISAATAPYLAFLDADDQWYPWHLQEAMPALQNNNVAMVGATYHQWPQQTDMSKLWAHRGISPGTYQIKGNESAEFVESFVVLFHVDTTVVRTEIARRYGGFFEQGCRHGEDIIFFAKIIFNESFALLGGKPAARYNRQDSELTSTYAFSLNPMLLDPNILLNGCPVDKRGLARNMLARLALRTAFHKARNGYKADALTLVRLHPQMKTFGWAWRQCQFAITFSSVLPYWVKLKCWIGPPVRKYLRHLAYKLKLLERPPSILPLDSMENKP
jgi:glycosyltransferase involved in cell wall biosynthesis